MVTMNRASVWYGWWRPSQHPSVNVPFGGRSVGRARVEPGWRHGNGVIHWVNVYWGVEGTVGLEVNGRRYDIAGGEMLIHPPESVITGFAIDTEGEYRWMTIDGPMALATCEALGLDAMKPHRAGRCPVELFDELESEIRDVTSAAEFRASATAYYILSIAARRASVGSSSQAENPTVARCLLAMDERFSDPELTIDRLAAELDIHRSRLSRLFTRAVGVPPSRHLQRLRLRQALVLLRDTTRTVAEVARLSGFSDPAYFSRCVRKEMRTTPRDLRGMM